MTAVWLDCPTHGYVRATDLVDFAPGAGGRFEDSHGKCPVDGAMVPMVRLQYSVGWTGGTKIEAFDDESAEELRKLREQHPDA